MSDMAALGDEFRAAREARGLSLEDVHERIHLRTAYLAAIEAEDWSSIGEPVYVRGFIRTYARFLGLDGERAVAQFTAVVPSEAPTARVAASQAADDTQRKGSSPMLLILGAIAVLLVAYVGYRYYQGRSIDVASVTSPRSDEHETATPDATPPPPARPTPKPSAAPLHNQLVLSVSAPSWVEIDVDGKAPVIGILPAGTKKVFSGKRVYVRAGNAGGVHIAVNGKDVGKLGGSGDVVERTFALP
jgi:transcriptional regulator with XRE-family HTH domain